MTRKITLLTHENFIAVGRMRYLEGMNYAEIAKRMGLKERQVNRIANRAGFPVERLPLRSVAEVEGLNQANESVQAPPSVTGLQADNVFSEKEGSGMSRIGRYHICQCSDRRRDHGHDSGSCKMCDCKQFKRVTKAKEHSGEDNDN